MQADNGVFPEQRFYMTGCEEEIQKKYPYLFNYNPVKEYIAKVSAKSGEMAAVSKKSTPIPLKILIDCGNIEKIKESIVR